MNDYQIRQVTEKDYQEVYNLIETAFKTAKVSDGDEQNFTVRLRNSENYIPELDLVAEQNGQLTGHIMLTHTHVNQPDGDKFRALLVAPLSVLPEFQNQGIGAALMKEGLRVAKEMGFKAAFLIGDPNYYKRLGYQPAILYGINYPGIPEQYTMVFILEADALERVTGTLEEAH